MIKLLTISIVVFSSISLLAQDRMTPEMLWDLKRIGNIQIAPNGKQMFYSVKAYDIKTNKSTSDLFIGEVNGLPAKQITRTAASEIDAQWSNDGSKILYLGKTDKGLNLFEMGSNGRDAKQISFIDGGINGFKVSADGSKILFIRDVKMNKVNSTEMYEDLQESNARVYDDLMYRHWGGWEDGKRSHIFVADFSLGKIEGEGVDIMPEQDFDAPLMPFGGMEQITFSADSKSIVYSCKKKVGKDYAISTNSDLYQYDISTGKTVNLTQGMMGYDNEAAFSKDGKKLAWLSMEKDGFEADKNDIIVMDITSGKKTNLTKEMDMTVSSFVWGSTSDVIYYKSCTEATYQLFSLKVYMATS